MCADGSDWYYVDCPVDDEGNTYGDLLPAFPPIEVSVFDRKRFCSKRQGNIYDLKFGGDCKPNETKCGSGVNSYCLPSGNKCYINDIKIGTQSSDSLKISNYEIAFLRNWKNRPLT